MASPHRIWILSLLGLGFVVGAVVSLPWRVGGDAPVSQRRARAMSDARNHGAPKINKSDEE